MTHEYITKDCDHRDTHLICQNCGFEWVVSTDCGDRICLICNQKRRVRILGQLKPIIKKMWYPNFLTLTIRRCELTRKNIQSIRKSFTKLRHRKIWLGVFRGFYNIELGTFHTDGTCNIHVHIVYDGPDIYQAYLSWQWSQVTKGSYVVDIRKCNSPKKVAGYVTKHFCKIIRGNYTSYQRKIINKVTKNMRLIQGFGTFRFMKPDKGPAICPECKAEGSFISSHNPMYYDVFFAFDGLEYDPQPA